MGEGHKFSFAYEFCLKSIDRQEEAWTLGRIILELRREVYTRDPWAKVLWSDEIFKGAVRTEQKVKASFSMYTVPRRRTQLKHKRNSN